MNSYIHLKLWTVSAILLAALIALLLPDIRLPCDSRSVFYLWENGHIVLFFLACQLLYYFVPRLSELGLFQLAIITICYATLGALLVEGLQCYLSGKSFEAADFVNDITGAFIFISYRTVIAKTKAKRLFAVTFLLLCIALWPAFRSLFDEILVQYQFPCLADFETPFEQYRFEGKTATVLRSNRYAFHGTHSLQISFQPGPWSGVRLKYFPSDWQGYSQLSVALYNPESHYVQFEIHIDSQTEQTNRLNRYRCSQHIKIEPQKWKVVHIPFNEMVTAPKTCGLNLAYLTSIGFYVEQELKPITLIMDSISLK